LGRLVAMAAALAAVLLLALAGAARGEEALLPIGIGVAGGEEWRAANDFDVFWTNPPGAQVAGAEYRLTGPEITDLAFAPGPGIDALHHLHVPYAGHWELSVWLRGADGATTGIGASVRLQLDDAPPLVSFMPGDATALPSQLVAAVADQLSGVADGTISYRRLDQERWTDLPTQIRAGALGIELAAPTPELKPGTAYVFRAEAVDGAGNVGSTTLRADGSPMQFDAPRAAAATGGKDGAGGGSVRPTSLGLGLGGARGAAASRTGLTVDAGEAVTLRGRLSAGDGGLAERQLRVMTRPDAGAPGGVTVESVTTGDDGRFELRLPAGPSRRIVVAFAGGDGLRPTRRSVSLRVRAAVTLRATRRRLRTGDVLRLSGRVGSRGARVPRSGKLVTISYWEREARRWRPVIVTRTDRTGRFRASYRFRYVSGRARIRLRATAPAEAAWPYAPGSSLPLTVEVSG
jgi:hypothetical protein